MSAQPRNAFIPNISLTPRRSESSPMDGFTVTMMNVEMISTMVGRINGNFPNWVRRQKLAACGAGAPSAVGYLCCRAGCSR